MKAWTNRLSSISLILVLPFSLIFITLGIIVVHSRSSQVQPISIYHLPTYNQDKASVGLQQAYVVPPIATDYTGDTRQQPANNVLPSSSAKTTQPTPSDNLGTNAATQASSPKPANSDQNSSLSNRIDMILSTIILDTQP